jgi:hypothetical protein
MYDPGNGLRYLVHFDDGGSGMRNRDRPLEPGEELVDAGGVLSGRLRPVIELHAHPAGSHSDGERKWIGLSGSL